VRRSAPLDRLDPAVKLAVVMVVSLTLLAVFDPVTPALLYALALVGVVAAARLPLRRLLLGQLPFVSFAISLLAVNAVTRGGRVLHRWGPLTVTDDGLAVGSSLALRTMVIGVCVLGFVGSTDPARLLTSLHQQGRLPVRATYALLAAYRLLDDLPAEWTTIRRAHAVRDPGRRPGRLPRSPAALGRAAFALMVSALRRGERVAIALESRGLGSAERTVWKPARLRRADLGFAATVLLVLVGVLVLTAWLGVLRGPGALRSD
jgi:energy-coupling factor transporter transmembrane protein EcfT